MAVTTALVFHVHGGDDRQKCKAVATALVVVEAVTTAFCTPSGGDHRLCCFPLAVTTALHTIRR